MGIGPTRGGRRLPGLVWSKEALGHIPSRKAVSFHGSHGSGEFLRPRFGRVDRIQVNGCPAFRRWSVARGSSVLIPKHSHELYHIGIHVGSQLINRPFECGETHGIDNIGWCLCRRRE
ncbi:hypothetical protein CRG98_008523, partial [Punica granatum]